MAETRDEWIQKRAYALWEEEGHPTGRDSIHWEKARAEHDALKGVSKSPNGKEVKPRAKRAAAAKTQAPAAAEITNDGEAKKPAKRAAASTKTNGIIKPAPKRTAVRKSAS